MIAKRLLDVIGAAIGLGLLAPMYLLIAVSVLLTDGSPVLFRQIRVGRSGREFRLLKFRTMKERSDAESGSFDAGDTSRVTRVGRWLRRLKLDELPQLWNVLRGEMSLVGPRPEVRRWVEAYPDRWERVLTARPGVTDPASIEYADEESVLAGVDDPEAHYRDVILPHKLDLYEEYVASRTLLGDLRILGQTFVRLCWRSSSHGRAKVTS